MRYSCSVFFKVVFIVCVQLNLSACVQRLTSKLHDSWSTFYGNNTPNSRYDFIIIGAGPAGCVLANRLSENKQFSVVLVEAGKQESPLLTDIPMGSPNLQSTDYNWGYATEPQKKACLSMTDHRCNWPHGRGVGGSSVINYMIYTRGNRRDFDRWNEQGCTGWSYEDVLPYFKKSEDAMDGFNFNPKYHGKGGPLIVEYPPYRTPFADAFVSAASESGYPMIDYNAAEQMGVSYIQSNTKTGWRNSAAKAFLEPIIKRKNLHVIIKTRAIKLHFSHDRERVVGIDVLNNKRKLFIKANREIILAAGAFESPKLLMLSGIGPKDDLRKFGINLIKDLPVGKTLYEHISVYGPIFTASKSSDKLINMNDVLKPRSILDYFAGKGPLTSSGIEALLYMKTNNSVSSDPGYPDIELMQALATVGFDLAPGTRSGIRLSPKAYESVFKPLEHRRAFQFLPMLLHPRSKGYLTLKSRNPFHHPLFYPNFFSDERDLDTILGGIREAIRITSHVIFKSMGVTLYKANVPGCEKYIFNTDPYWKCYIKHLSATLHHQVGTCKMGSIDDPSTVVNAKALVHGIQNLRVADVGIIPEAPSGHTAAYSFMIGEKVADMIKTDWNQISQRGKRLKRSFDWQKIESTTEFIHTIKNYVKKPTIVEKEKFWNELYSGSTTPEMFKIGDAGLILWGNSNINESAKQNVENISEALQNSTTGVYESTQFLESNTDLTTEPAIERIINTVPYANEDLIKTVHLKDDEQYGRGTAKPKLISLKLSQINSTEYSKDDFD